MAVDQDVDPKRLARTFLKTLLQIGEVNKQGPEAIELVRNTILRDAFVSMPGVRRVRSKRTATRQTAKDDKPKRTVSPATRKAISDKMKKHHRNKRKERESQEASVA
jgi:hypothetical protein